VGLEVQEVADPGVDLGGDSGVVNFVVVAVVATIEAAGTFGRGGCMALTDTDTHTTTLTGTILTRRPL
jgi:hypothetical protein